MGYFSLVLHAHLPFVRHPEHEHFLEEKWLFEAITETYIPLLQLLDGWRKDQLPARLTLTLTPTLCSMLTDSLLQQRYHRHLNDLIGLTRKEIIRTHWEKPLRELANFYTARLESFRNYYTAREGDLLGAFREFHENGLLEIITSAATHAVLPLMNHKPSVRAQVLVACDHFQECFGHPPQGIWLPECGYSEELEPALCEAGIRWFILDTHGILNANPQPRYAVFAPVVTQSGLVAFGRDAESAQQVWSRQKGYPGHPQYREFYRDAGFDLDVDYLKSNLPWLQQRGYTGIKYHRITGHSGAKEIYDRPAALSTADQHAQEFLNARLDQIRKLREVLDRSPLILAPYDAELFGHWWYEGPEFLDSFVRKACLDQKHFKLITPGDYLSLHPINQVAAPSPSTWGEAGYSRVWLNEKNDWIYRHLAIAQQRMTELANDFPSPDELQQRALKQAGRELLLAQSSDWPFILSTGTSPDYAVKRIKEHLFSFTKLYDELRTGTVSQPDLERTEGRDNLFPNLNYKYWAG